MVNSLAAVNMARCRPQLMPQHGRLFMTSCIFPPWCDSPSIRPLACWNCISDDSSTFDDCIFAPARHITFWRDSRPVWRSFRAANPIPKFCIPSLLISAPSQKRIPLEIRDAWNDPSTLLPTISAPQGRRIGRGSPDRDTDDAISTPCPC